jgi:D-alanyl-D-alanine carboxypeptidase (penicillin-binding protein 5/6)
MLLIMENIEKGTITWDDVVTVSVNASSMGGSQILLETGEQMSVYDLFKGLSVASGNDVVVSKKQS